MSTTKTPNLEPATARRLADQLKLVSGKTLTDLLCRVEQWKAHADRKHEDLIRRAGAGANNLRRAVKAWDEALPILHRAIQAAQARLGDAPAPAAVAETAVPPVAEPVQETALAPAKPARGRKAAATNQAKSLSGLDAAAQVLREAGEPLDAQEIVKRMLDRGLWSTNGKTPAATIYAAIIREIGTKGEQTRFRKVSRGHFEAVT